MDWKKQRENAYPSIILSDCFVDEIRVNDKDIEVDFLRFGFIIKETEDSEYYHTKPAQIVMKDCDIDDISIQFVYRKKTVTGNISHIIKDIEPCVFLKDLSRKKWSYEIVEEYYSALGGLFIGKIHEAKNSMWCYIKIQFKNIIYYWNEVNYDFPVR
ncbi:MAG: hypothetical protein NC548_41495 [Lachnospiraceae bacterium]|nr:hypothetical protein [Lachnospiraceae bacterium]